MAAITERDAAITAAENEEWTALNALRVAQGATSVEPNTLPTGKADIIRRFMKLSDDQTKAMNETAIAGFGKIREAMKGVQRPADPNDAAARTAFGELMRKIRDQVDGETADVMAVQLSDDQRKAYQAAVTVYDASQKKIQDARSACEKKITDLGLTAVPQPAEPGGFPGGRGGRGGAGGNNMAPAPAGAAF